ncbi:Similar to homeobox and C2H2 transcription factor, putative [Penicillium marneffei ATCC 18224]; acc. no. XP_002146929 [Pyronema omphalodes CBS 100304]|uniref:Similar to homeobox and C2H2 transcription factor, putative [Penicillium marneffei ATCC 18224] acc. no. XP_002146929 n=1 Tax=Pyronema omphalodes (strain CBS 100304) TaxID=1076935 RepID=U4L0Y4_PYROM|nr:Similar to homeobox and C2H2 transcription factor, putative [Penicillium marneffei ATCC 18224]; acc. no. XP_002146929 [Pyronema omphalodes CBS 100304]
MQRYENNKTASFTPHAPYAKHYLPLTQNTAEMEYSNLSQVRISPYTPPCVISAANEFEFNVSQGPSFGTAFADPNSIPRTVNSGACRSHVGSLNVQRRSHEQRCAESHAIYQPTLSSSVQNILPLFPDCHQTPVILDTNTEDLFSLESDPSFYLQHFDRRKVPLDLPLDETEATTASKTWPALDTIPVYDWDLDLEYLSAASSPYSAPSPMSFHEQPSPAMTMEDIPPLTPDRTHSPLYNSYGQVTTTALDNLPDTAAMEAMNLEGFTGHDLPGFSSATGWSLPYTSAADNEAGFYAPGVPDTPAMDFADANFNVSVDHSHSHSHSHHTAACNLGIGSSSYGTQGNPCSSVDKTLEQRRKLPQRKAYTPSTDRPVIFQCTFCISEFDSRPRWVRHEEEKHLVQEEWTCAPHGWQAADGSCVFCPPGSSQGTSSQGGCSHRTQSHCGRVFSRKGHLKQHLKRVHHAEWRNDFEHWGRKYGFPETSSCGFCGQEFQEWKARRKHIAHEFAVNRRTMEEWQGEWGLPEWWKHRLHQATIPKDR